LTTYYISCEGNDANSGTDEAHPWRDPGKISSYPFLPGDVIRLRRGDEFRTEWNVSFVQGGHQGAPITLTCYGNPEAPYPWLEAQHKDSFCSLELSKPWLALRHLQLGGRRNGLVISNAPACHVAEMIVADCGWHGIQLSRLYGANPDSRIETVQAYNCGGMGISLTTERNLVCSYNYVRRCCLDEHAPAGDLNLNYTAGIKIFGVYGGSNCVLEHNTCEENGNSAQHNDGVHNIAKGCGLWIDSPDHGSVRALNNICRNNTNSGIMVELTERIDVYGNRCYRNGRGMSEEPANNSGIVLFRGANHNRVKYNTCFENGWQTCVTGYDSLGEEGISQLCVDNVFEENTLLSRHHQHAYECVPPCDPARQMRVNEVSEGI
jgi:hypothetical protein